MRFVNSHQLSTKLLSNYTLVGGFLFIVARYTDFYWIVEVDDTYVVYKSVPSNLNKSYFSKPYPIIWINDPNSMPPYILLPKLLYEQLRRVSMNKLEVLTNVIMPDLWDRFGTLLSISEAPIMDCKPLADLLYKVSSDRFIRSFIESVEVEKLQR